MNISQCTLIRSFITVRHYEMSEGAVIDWESTIHKNVRSKDGQDAGNVDAIEGDIVVITSEGDRKDVQSAKITSRRIRWCRSLFENYFWRIRAVQSVN